MKQHTIKKAVSVKGIGLHTGLEVKLTFKPAPANHGIRFQRIDLEDKPTIVADVNKVVSTNRSTTIKDGNAEVVTVEHVLSAITGLGIDNILIELDSKEIPIMDGSAIPFVKALEKAKIEAQTADRVYFTVNEVITYKDETSGAELMLLPSDHFELTTLIDFDSPVLGKQFATLTDLSDYKKEIAPCRTFVFLRELEVLLKQNLIKGGDLDNAIVIADKKMNSRQLSALAKKLGKKEVKVEEAGVLNTTKLKFKNEAARHKLLDLIGDLTLLGSRIKGKIIATKPGHRVNVEFVKQLKKRLLEQKKLRGKPHYDPNQTPLYDTVQIAAMLPHRYPFLLIDKIIELTDTHVVGIKNVTFNENYFQGHFPNNPVMPGVLQIEAMAQTGGILALSNVPNPENWDTYFLKIDNAKFKHKIIPGDTVIFKLELTSPIRRGIVQMRGTAYVGNQIVSEANLTAQILDRTLL